MSVEGCREGCCRRGAARGGAGDKGCLRGDPHWPDGELQLPGGRGTEGEIERGTSGDATATLEILTIPAYTFVLTCLV